MTIALEPECAAIFCNKLSKGQLEIKGADKEMNYVLAPGSVAMVVDMGGKNSFVLLSPNVLTYYCEVTMD